VSVALGQSHSLSSSAASLDVAEPLVDSSHKLLASSSTGSGLALSQTGNQHTTESSVFSSESSASLSGPSDGVSSASSSSSSDSASSLDGAELVDGSSDKLLASSSASSSLALSKS